MTAIVLRLPAVGDFWH